MDNADIVTAACAAREHYAEELRIARLQRAVHDARIALLEEFLEALTPKAPRRTRPSKTDTPPDATQGTLQTVEDLAA